MLQEQKRGRLLLVVDQWEDLYMLVTDPADRNAFIDRVLAVADGKRLTLLLAVRADFVGHMLEHRALAARLNEAPLGLGMMTSDELRAAIDRFLSLAGIGLDPEIPNRAIEEVGCESLRVELAHEALLGWPRLRGIW